MKGIESLVDDIMDLFHGLMNHSISYSYDKLNCAMKTDICEVFSSVAEDVVMKVEFGGEVTLEQLQALHDNLISFAKEFEVKEARALAKKVKKLIENNQSDKE